MAILSVDHPDIEEFVDMKNDLSVMTNFNVSVAVTEKFMEEVEQDADHALINPRTGAVARTIPARYLFNKIVHNAWQTGEPGIVFIDRINASRSNPTPQLGLVESTNPCVTGDTRLHTQYGLMTIHELYERQLPITATVDTRVVNEHRGATTRSAIPVFMTAADADVFRVVTEDGYEIRATEWHDFFTTRGKVKLRDLQPGDELLVQSGEGQWGEAGDYNLGLLVGLITGDGYITADRGACVNLWGADQALMPKIAEYVNSLVVGTAQGKRKEYVVQPVVVPDRDLTTLRSTRLGRILEERYGFTIATKLRVPEVVWQGSRECVVGYLQGLFQTDGTVQISAEKDTCSIRLASSTRSLLGEVQSLLANFGVFSSIKLRRNAGARLMPDGKGGQKSYQYQAQYELIIGGESRTRFLDAVGFPLPNKRDRVRAWAEGRVLRKTQPFITPVAEIIYEGREAVYDTTQEDRNTVIFNGIVTGQCGEQPLLPYEACNLGSINVGRLTVERDGKVDLDWDALRDVVHLATRALEDVIEMNKYPIPEIEEMTTRNRRIGVGLMGWADLLFKLRIPYNSEEATDLAERMMKFIDDEAKNASEQLAAERGPFPNWEESIYGPQGQHWPNAQGVRPLRNSTVSTIAPTGTISIIAGASGGIEPLFSLAFMRTIMDKDKLLEVNKIFEQVAKEEGFYSAELMEEVAATGTLAHIEGIPDWVKRVFVTARDVTPEWHARMQAAFQKSTDNAVSKTVNFPPEATEDEVREVYELAYRLGCKGVTIYRDGSRSEQPMSTVAKKPESSAAAVPVTVPLAATGTAAKANGNGNGNGHSHDVPEIVAEVRQADAQPPVDVAEPQPVLPRPLPDGDISGWLGRIKSPQGTVRVWVSEVDDQPYETYIVLGKSGSDLMALTEGIGRMMSIALRAGIPVEILIDQLRGIGGSRSVGFGTQRVLSVPDAIAKLLQEHYFPEPDAPAVPATRAVAKAAPAVVPVAPPVRRPIASQPLGDICPECGNATLMHVEGCKKCPCGHSEC